ncbi:MAG: tyrosine--tRNA ligase, partial [Flavisolibacter sp.]|nr:tyrosine--tRNA ligase [Flavisolibacter sp.]
SKRILQRRIAQEITIFVHGEEEYRKAIATTEKLFTQQNVAAERLSVEDLEAIEGIIKVQLPIDNLLKGVDVVTLLAETGIFTSKGEARKMIQNGGVSINRNKVDSPQWTVDSSQLLHQKYLLIQKGKKNYYLVKAV